MKRVAFSVDSRASETLSTGPSHLLRIFKAIIESTEPQAVVRDFDRRKFLIFPAESQRFEAMQRDPTWGPRIVGVFTSTISFKDFAREVAA